RAGGRTFSFSRPCGRLSGGAASRRAAASRAHRAMIRFARRGRTLLAIAGVAVSAAMLLDMVMLASGMRASFRELLVSRGYQIRLAPRGTLPFDTEATIRDASSIAAQVAADSSVLAVSPVLVAQ